MSGLCRLRESGIGAVNIRETGMEGAAGQQNGQNQSQHSAWQARHGLRTPRGAADTAAIGSLMLRACKCITA